MNSSEIITIDAVVITGLLILITIGATVENTPNYNRFTALGTLLIIPFSISAILELRKAYKGTKELNRKTGAGWMLGGFFFLFIIMIVIFTAEFFKTALFKAVGLNP